MDVQRKRVRSTISLLFFIPFRNQLTAPRISSFPQYANLIPQSFHPSTL
jgi:hypothetical protein